MAIADGYYTIRCEADGKVLDIQGSSTARNAALIAYVAHGGNNQTFKLVNVGSAFLLYPAHTIGMEPPVEGIDRDMRIGVSGATSYGQAAATIDGFGIKSNDLWGVAGGYSPAELWSVEETSGTLVVNGVEYPTYRIKSSCEDESGRDHYLTPPESYGANVCIVREAYEGTAGLVDVTRLQRWAFVPTVPVDDPLPIPYSGSASEIS